MYLVQLYSCQLLLCNTHLNTFLLLFSSYVWLLFHFFIVINLFELISFLCIRLQHPLSIQNFSDSNRMQIDIDIEL